jgi:putative nucleotidyltransferase with HDIG domain
LARAGIVVGISGVVFWMLLFLLNVRSGGGGDQLQILIAAMVAGLLSYVFAIAFVPLFEWLFGYLTDVKLMEYININHPALKELFEKARGTYDHSTTVAKLVEVASEAISANTLLAKAGAYFHDLGKLAAKDSPYGEKPQAASINSPQYFVENQDGVNPHDNLSPAMSARIIRRHVSKSLEMIRRFGLGKEIEDIAAQHHGTTVMQYFYQRAVEQALDSQQVNEDDYRYPGPKPQTKESGIVMLADTVEAAVRTLKEHTEGRIRAKVEQLINEKIEDKQFDECPLTFQEFGQIRDAFVQALTAMYHSRVSYPEKRRETQMTVRIRRPEEDLKDLTKEQDKDGLQDPDKEPAKDPPA